MVHPHPDARRQPTVTESRTDDLSWGVRGGRWDALAPEIAAMVAPPIVVTALSRPVVVPAALAVPAAAAGSAGPLGRRTPAAVVAAPTVEADRRLERPRFPSGRGMLAPAQPRGGRHRRPARAG